MMSFAVMSEHVKQKNCLTFSLNFKKRFPLSEVWLCLTPTNIHFYNYYLGCTYVFVNPALRNDSFACIRSLKGYTPEVHIVAGNFYRDSYPHKRICFKVR